MAELLSDTPAPTDPAPAAETRRFTHERLSHDGDMSIIDTATGFVVAVLKYDYAYTCNTEQYILAERICDMLAQQAAAPPAPVGVGELVERLRGAIGVDPFHVPTRGEAQKLFREAAVALTALSAERDELLNQEQLSKDIIGTLKERAEQAERERDAANARITHLLHEISLRNGVVNNARARADQAYLARKAAEQRAEGLEREVVFYREQYSGLIAAQNKIVADQVAAAEQRAARMAEALEKIAQLQRDKCENADAEMLFALLDIKVEIARAALCESGTPKGDET